MTGTILRLFDRGFGFLVDNAGREIFFHANQCNTAFETLAVSDLVIFSEITSPKGPCAVEVQKI